MHTVPRFVAVHDVHVVPSWRRFQLKSTPRVASYSLSLFLSSPSSIPVLSQFRRWLDVVYRSRCLFLSYLRKIVFSFFSSFSLFLSLFVSYSVDLSVSSLCYCIPVSFFSFALFPTLSFLPSFFLSLLFDSCFVSVSFFLFFLFRSFPPRPRRLPLMKNSRISRLPMKSCCRVKLMEGWSIGPGAFICRYFASHLARRFSLRLRG